MTTEGHQLLGNYLTAIRSTIENDDAFGQFLLRMVYRADTGGTRGIFHTVQELCDSVIALGGKLEEARAWTNQAYNWTQSGKAVDHKFARYEIDSRASGAMDTLLKMVDSWSFELCKSSAPHVTSNKPAPNPFKPSSPFGSRPSSPFGRPSNPFQPSETLPFYVGTCFDVLAVQPDAPKKPNPFGGGTPAPFGAKPTPPDLPTDLQGLLDHWHKIGHTGTPFASARNEEIARTLREIGRLDDMRALDHMFNLTRHGEVELNLTDIFSKVGGNVGIAGLIALLPVIEKNRVAWLTALCNATRTAMRSDHPLNSATLDTVWKIAVAESAPTVVFCPPAVKLLAATRRRESIPILWEHARSEDAKRRQTALYALAEIDPGDSLDALLTAFAVTLDAVPTPSSPFSAPPEAIFVGIPFEALEAAIHSSKHKLRPSAVKLIGHIDDPRVVPLLITQLSSKIGRVREIALQHLRRLRATNAADAVARLMLHDEAMQRRAAETLLTWNDIRCVPVLVRLMQNDDSSKPQDIVKKIGTMQHPAFTEWVDSMVNGYETQGEDGISGLIDLMVALADSETPLIEGVLKRLMKSPYSKIREMAALGLAAVKAEWAEAALQVMAFDHAPEVTYRAAQGIQSREFAQTLLTNRSKIKRLLGVRILWAARDIDGLLNCLNDGSSAVSSAAAWCVAQLVTPTTAETLWRLVEEEDRVNMWGFNLATIAWNSLARMGLTRKKSDEVAAVG